MKFLDEVELDIRAGKGGRGAKSFRREAGVPMGGPDGGNGGKGGNVVVKADRNLHTLLDLHFRPLWHAEDGDAGSGSRKDGKAGTDLLIRVPVGTECIDAKSGTVIIDLTVDEQEFILAKGGRGGKGNAFFKTSTNQAPEHFQPGEEGAAGIFKLSLKLMADAGLLGFPNAGKSTLISRVSAARPKIADYPFTTLTPNLGVARTRDGRSFVIADIPGLIPGAHAGKGLGITFLKHLERTRVLIHLIDPYQLQENGEPMDALEAFDLINAELVAFSQQLSERPQIVVLTKADLAPDLSAHQEISARFRSRSIEVMSISSVTGLGIDNLLIRVADQVFAAGGVLQTNTSEDEV